MGGVQVPLQLYNKIRELFYHSGPQQDYLEEKQGQQSIVRRNWFGKEILSLLLTLEDSMLSIMKESLELL